jgi:hypothetical protein
MRWRKQASAFVFEKKKQKTFVHLAWAGHNARAQVRKVFLVLFFQKKNRFLPDTRTSE